MGGKYEGWITSGMMLGRVPIQRNLGAILLATLCFGETIVTSKAANIKIESVETQIIPWISQQDRAGKVQIDDLAFSTKRAVALSNLLKALISGDEAAALTQGIQGGFNIFSFKREPGDIFGITDKERPDEGPTIILNPRATKDLIASAPHPINENGTFQQAVLLVTKTNIRAAVIAGAHRCASRTFVGCDGRTRTCGAYEAYRTSDVAHSPHSLFHVAHQVFAIAWPRSIILSLHGMRTDRKGVRTSVILSNGIKNTDVYKNTAATRLRVAMTNVFPDEGAVVSCNISADRQHNFRRLCGTTNVQGRMINGDDDVCHGSVYKGTGRFIHIEQDSKVRNLFVDRWQDISGNTFMNKYLSIIGSVAPRVR